MTTKTPLAVLLLLVLGSAATPADDRPNILLVLSDDQSAAHVGCYGNPDIRTPNLDRFASQGVRFNRAYVASPQCAPSRSAMMTGRSPVATDMTRFSAPLPRAIPIFPELLRAAGYFAGVAGRGYHLDGSGNPPAETERVFEAHHLRTFTDRLDYVKSSGRREQMLGQYREFLDLVPEGKPFVLQLCFSDPHRPYDPKALATPHDPKALTLPDFYPDTEGVRADFANYYDEIARFDGDFGTVLDELDRRGLADTTLVAFMGDNGSAQFRGKGTLYEFGIRVPLIVRMPGASAKAGSAIDHLVSGEDLAPTFLELAGVEVPDAMTGRSFLPTLRGGAYEPREYVFAERGAHGSGLPTSSSAFDLGRCVVSDRYKLIYNALWQIPYTPVDFAGQPFWKELQQMHADGKLSDQLDRLYFAPTRPMFEVYDLRSDPSELENLADRPEAREVATRLKAALQEWMILERDYLPLPVPPGG